MLPLYGVKLIENEKQNEFVIAVCGGTHSITMNFSYWRMYDVFSLNFLSVHCRCGGAGWGSERNFNLRLTRTPIING